MHPSRVVLTNGSLHGLALLAAPRRARAERHGRVPDLRPRRAVLLAAGASLLGTPIDEDGMSADELHSMLVQYVDARR